MEGTMAMKKLMVVLAGLLLSLSSVGAAQEVSTVISGWDKNHPEAASSLASLVRSNAVGAGRMFLWNRDHPLRSQSFVAWINEHQDQTLDDFISSHRYWPVVDLVMKPYRATFEAFIAWGRAHPDATRELASEPKALAWVGFHVFGDQWDSRAPQLGPTDAAEPAGLPATPPPPPQDLQQVR
jgi:hypothetical protein